AGQQFLPGGALAPFRNGLAGSGGDGPSLNTSYDLRAPLDRLNLLAGAFYDVTHDVRLSGDFRLANVRAGTGIFPDFSVLSIKTDNAFLPAAAHDQLVAAGAPNFLIGRYNTDFGLVSSKVERDTYQGTIALDGSLGKSVGKTFTWNAYYTHGEQIR